jgi:hypothetical protein
MIEIFYRRDYEDFTEAYAARPGRVDVVRRREPFQ